MSTLPSSPQGKQVIASVASELKEKPPAIVNSTRRKFGVERAAKQRTAIMLSKARQAGVKIPSYSPGKLNSK